MSKPTKLVQVAIGAVAASSGSQPVVADANGRIKALGTRGPMVAGGPVLRGRMLKSTTVVAGAITADQLVEGHISFVNNGGLAATITLPSAADIYGYLTRELFTADGDPTTQTAATTALTTRSIPVTSFRCTFAVGTGPVPTLDYGAGTGIEYYPNGPANAASGGTTLVLSASAQVTYEFFTVQCSSVASPRVGFYPVAILALGGATGPPSWSQTLAIGNTSGAYNPTIDGGQYVLFVTGVAIGGNNNTATTGNGTAIAIGAGSAATTTSTVAIGNLSSASANNGTAVGSGSNTAGFASSTALGYNATNTAANQIMLGSNLETVTFPGKGLFVGGIAVGGNNLAATASNTVSIAIGGSSTASALGAVVVGPLSTASGGSAVALGYGTQATQNYSVAIGGNAQSTAVNGIAIGEAALADQSSAVAVGAESGGVAINAVGIGYRAFAGGVGGAGVSSIAIGPNSTASAVDSIAHGNSTLASASYSIAIGNSANATVQYGIALGKSSTASADSATALGRLSTASGASSVAAGNSSAATGASSAAYGAFSSAGGTRSIAIGNLASAANTNSIALGYSATASFDNSTALGYQAVCTAANQIVIGTASETTVHLGDITLQRHLGTAGSAITPFSTSGVITGAPGVGGVILLTGSTDIAGQVSTSTTGAGLWTVRLNFANAFSQVPIVIVSALANTTAYLQTYATTYIVIEGTAVGGTTIGFTYLVVGRF